MIATATTTLYIEGDGTPSCCSLMRCFLLHGLRIIYRRPDFKVVHVSDGRPHIRTRDAAQTSD